MTLVQHGTGEHNDPNARNPETTKGKIYVITSYGKNILKEISKL